ncbi:PREDICTED: uncharacterized protein LOC106931314 isoform X1 [Poecilia mexicana]|uniref:uncharacterized protein LOC106931314 isoform X1 n=2 Tax=Poecilia mexicana TaxID=48701 RepID=UPI00072D944C|nr:PREDICTED: uncharacterized protein LOC106931314 isoform X1 [Poecilia mexicana]
MPSTHTVISDESDYVKTSVTMDSSVSSQLESSLNDSVTDGETNQSPADSSQVLLQTEAEAAVVQLSDGQTTSVAGVIQAPQTSVIQSPQVQTVQIVTVAELGDGGSVGDTQKRRELLSRRPSYRKILNELSSDSPSVPKIDEEKGEDEAAVSSSSTESVPNSIYQTSSGQYRQSDPTDHPSSGNPSGDPDPDGDRLPDPPDRSRRPAGCRLITPVLLTGRTGAHPSCHRRHSGLPAAFAQLGPGSEHRDGCVSQQHAEPVVAARRGDHPQEGGQADEKQGGSARVPQEKERIRQMSGKPRSCAGKPKQDTDRRAESTEGHLLSQSRVAGDSSQTAATYQKRRTTEQKINCFNRLCFFAHSGLTYAKL